eukprot:29106-Amphidinium_carterae.1
MAAERRRSLWMPCGSCHTAGQVCEELHKGSELQCGGMVAPLVGCMRIVWHTLLRMSSIASVQGTFSAARTGHSNRLARFEFCYEDTLAGGAMQCNRFVPFVAGEGARVAISCRAAYAMMAGLAVGCPVRSC